MVVVLRVDSAIHYDRLAARSVVVAVATASSFHIPSSRPENANEILQYRNYPEVKLQENIDSEIMEVLLQEARDSYDEEIVIELQSNTTEDLETNVERIEAWYRQWKEDNKDR